MGVACELRLGVVRSRATRASPPLFHSHLIRMRSSSHFFSQFSSFPSLSQHLSFPFPCGALHLPCSTQDLHSSFYFPCAHHVSFSFLFIYIAALLKTSFFKLIKIHTIRFSNHWRFLAYNQVKQVKYRLRAIVFIVYSLFIRTFSTNDISPIELSTIRFILRKIAAYLKGFFQERALNYAFVWLLDAIKISMNSLIWNCWWILLFSLLFFEKFHH